VYVQKWFGFGDGMFFVIGYLWGCSTTGKTSLLIGEDSSMDEDSVFSAQEEVIDNDGDGFSLDDDCDDSNPLIHPAATELCNGIDDNCNDEIDEGVLIDWFFDFDEDGYGSDFLEQACVSIPGAVILDGDCDDNNPLIHPNSTQRVDGIDSDCNGTRDWLVQIYVAVDDAGELCVNNQVLGDTGGWSTGVVYETWMATGPTVVGIYGWDVGYTITAGIIHLELSDGTQWVSDSTWTYSPNPSDSASKSGWCSVGYDDGDWEPVQVIGPIGTSPWGNAPAVFPQGSPAQWIWDYFPVELNSQYLRKEIVLP